MTKFTKITSTCLSIPTENIDTDQIIPARFLKLTGREGFGKYLFYDWRFDQNGKQKNSQFDYTNYHNTQILIAGNNFGYGSSREHAVWALLDFGFQAIISSSFGDIFYNNALKNGLLPVPLRQTGLNKLFDIIKKNPQVEITVNLETQTVSCHPALDAGSMGIAGQAGNDKKGIVFHFPIDPFHKTCLLKGVDELGYILSFEKQITEFEKKHNNFISV